MIFACACGFRGKEPELINGHCPRCGADLKPAPEPATEPRSRRRRS